MAKKRFVVRQSSTGTKLGELSQGDPVIVSGGSMAGETGTVIQLFRGIATVQREDKRSFTVDIGLLQIADIEHGESAENGKE